MEKSKLIFNTLILGSHFSRADLVYKTIFERSCNVSFSKGRNNSMLPKSGCIILEPIGVVRITLIDCSICSTPSTSMKEDSLIEYGTYVPTPYFFES
jgi:hypothetical protein